MRGGHPDDALIRGCLRAGLRATDRAGARHEGTLERKLTPSEQRAIWNAGSLMMLELVERDLVAAQSAAAVEHELRSMQARTEKRFSRRRPPPPTNSLHCSAVR